MAKEANNVAAAIAVGPNRRLLILASTMEVKKKPR